MTADYVVEKSELVTYEERLLGEEERNTYHKG
jgi:hypothetical protein